MQDFLNLAASLKILPIAQVLSIADLSIEDGIEIYKKYVSIETQEREGSAAVYI